MVERVRATARTRLLAERGQIDERAGWSKPEAVLRVDWEIE